MADALFADEYPALERGDRSFAHVCLRCEVEGTTLTAQRAWPPASDFQRRGTLGLQCDHVELGVV